MKLDILVLAAHPDDAELTCSGTIASAIAKGKKVGIIDLTQGELGTRGSAETRKKEAELAAQIMGLHLRDNMQFADGFFRNDKEHQLALIEKIRTYKPTIVLANAISDRHPDHAKAAELIKDACFLAGLRKIETGQEAYRPDFLYHYIQDRYIQPDFVVDISDFWEIKKKAILAYGTQFNALTNDNEPQTYISTPEFFDFLEARAKEFGHQIGVRYGEGFTKTRMIGVKDLFDLH
ncbi:MAG: bacillithiol biosynthesis deacetylase BshB1 [Thermonemataceae bacterium]|nr:bacillithiol biosynthesis deacetylase BshB1 [Thermonemataceae bacterium]